jgi:phosphate transport system substrate-binding protein
MRRLPLLILPLLVGCTGGATAPGGGKTVRLNGSGATFVQPVMLDWASDFGGRTRHEIDYQGTGSGNGIQQLTAKTIDFGCSDAPMNKEQLAKAQEAGGDVAHVPLVLGAVAVIYNLDGIDKPLTFTGPLLADIYMGKVTKWNDPALAKLNPGVALPDLAIQPVFRSDSSGTTNIFTEYLAKVSDEFRTKVGASTAPSWPKGVGIGQPKSDGLTGHVQRTKGAVGYVELTYALETKGVSFGAVTNKAGQPVRPSLGGITAAAAATLGTKPTAEPYSLHDLTYSLTDADGAESYPISGISYALLYQKQNSTKGRVLVEFLRWATGPDGQKLATERNYAPLPEGLVKQIHAKLDTIELAP